MTDHPKSVAVEAVGDCLLDRKAVAEVLGVSPGALNVARHRGTFTLEPVRFGRRLRWRASDVRRWIEQGGDPDPAAAE